jgi:peptidyl-prolyl cis-trans isomerase C
VTTQTKRFAIWMFLLGIALTFAACAKKEPIVAKVGSYGVTVEDFKTGFIQKYRGEEAAKKRSFDDRRSYAEELANEKLLVAEAYSLGYDKRPEVEKEVEQMAKRKSLDLLYQKEIMDKAITEEALKRFYERSGEELRARHILVKVAPVDTTEDAEKEAKRRIDSIRQAIVDGLDFGEAAMLYSDDATTARDSGNLGWFSWGRMVDEFQEAAWALDAGEMSKPVRSSYGWHLIFVQERKPVPQRPYEEQKASIKQQMYRSEGEKLNEMARKYLEALRKKANLEYHQDVWQMMSQKVSDPAAPIKKQLGDYFTEKEKENVIASYKGGTVTVKDICDKVGGRMKQLKWDDEKTMEDLVASIAEPVLLERDAERKGLLKKAYNIPEIKQRKEQQIKTLLEKEEVTDKVVMDSAEVEAYYLSHLGNFIEEEQRTVREIFIKDSAKAARIARRAKKGEDFEKLTKLYNEKESTKASNGLLGPFNSRRMGLIGSAAFELKDVGDVAGPIRVGKNYSVIKLLNIIPSRTKTLEEAWVSAQREWRVSKTEELQEQLRNRLKEKYTITIFDDVLAKVWPQVEELKTQVAADSVPSGH